MISIDEPGPSIDVRQLDELARAADVALPDSYRQFLLKYNGGRPTPDVIHVAGLSGSPTDIQLFFGIGRNIRSSDLRWNLSMVADRCADRRLLPIACDSGGNLFCFSVEFGIASEIVYLDLNNDDCILYSIAPNFDSFIAKITALG